MQDSDKKRIIASISSLGGKVTAADVATETGLSPDNVTRGLNEIAWETGGSLLVAESGAIAYSFSPGFAGKYFARGLALYFQRLQKRASEIGYFLLRISFGVGLILSVGLFLIIAMPGMLFAMIGGELDELTGEDGQKRSKKGKKGKKPATKKSTATAPLQRRTPREKLKSQLATVSTFVQNCFSFLFGDGNPNAGLEEERWRLIARAIRARHYALTADELSPYTDGKPENEDAVLPVLVRFNGKPEVTDSGNIIYVFPALQTEVAEHQQKELPEYLEETEWQFSKLSDQELQPVVQMAFVNLIGSWGVWLYFAARGGWHVPPLLFNVVVTYGSAFLVLPIQRYGFIEKLNAEIKKRNKERSSYAERLNDPKGKLKEKLAETEQFKLQVSHIQTQDVVYATDQDALDQPDELTEKFNFT